MAKELYSKTKEEEISPYYKYKENIDKEILKISSTVYIGNLSYNTTEAQLYQLFSFCGKIKRVILGLNRFTKEPCGFAFVEYLNRESAVVSKNTLTGFNLNGKVIKVDIDLGFEEGRQYGRGKFGYQIRDELNTNYDPQRPWKKNNGRQYSSGRNYNGNNYRNNDRRNRSRSRNYERNRSRSRSRSRSKDRSRSRNYHNRNRHY